MSAIGEGNITFWQRLKRQKHGLGNMALVASTCVLALRLIDQDKQLQHLRQGESSLLDALRRENQTAQDRFASFRAAVEAEVERAGSRLPPLSTRLRNLLEQNKIEEPRPFVSPEDKKESGFRVLTSKAKLDELKRHLHVTDDCAILVRLDYRRARVRTGQEAEVLQSQDKGKTSFMV